MNILYIGDIMAEPGIRCVEQTLSDVVNRENIDIVIAQSENVSEGKGMTPQDMSRLQNAGVNFFTGGNHTPNKQELFGLLEDTNAPVIGPANMLHCPGPGWKYLSTPQGNVLIVSLLGATVGKPVEISNPLEKIDAILGMYKNEDVIATIVNFHGDYSSEKVIVGHYLDGRASLVVGDHWHVPTADERILPKGTAHQTDVGMCGVLDSSLGIKLSTVIPRWRDGLVNKNIIETDGSLQFNALKVSVGSNGLADAVKRIHIIH